MTSSPGAPPSHDAERAAAAWVLADLPLDTFLNEEIVPYETDEVTRLIIDSHDRQAFSAISHLTVGRIPRLVAGDRLPR